MGKKIQLLSLHEVSSVRQACSTLTSSNRVNRKWSLYLQIRWETGLNHRNLSRLRTKDISLGKLRVGKREVTVEGNLSMALMKYAIDYNIKGKLFPETIQGATYIWNKIKRKAELDPHLTLNSISRKVE